MEGSAEEARASIQCLVRLLNRPPQDDVLDPFAAIRRKDKRLTQELTEHLCATFVTPMEREDIEALSIALYKIPKTVEKFGERLLLAPQQLKGLDVSKQLAMLDKAAEVLVTVVKELRQGVDLQQIKAYNDVLQQIEGQADKLMVGAVEKLYSGNYDPLRVVIQKDLYELLEKVFDRCRDVGNIVFCIVLKHS